MFVSDRGVPRRRRPSDIGRAIVAAGACALLGWASANESALDVRLLTLFAGSPEWLRTLAWTAFVVSTLASFAVAALAMVRGGPGRGVTRDLVLATVLVGALSTLGAWLTSGAWPVPVPEVTEQDGFPRYPMLRLSLVAVVYFVLGPYVTRPVTRLLRWSLALTALSSMVLGITSLTGLFGSLAMGFAAVAVVRLLFGSPEGLPTIAGLRDTLDHAGLAVTDLAYLERQPGTVGLATATMGELGPLDIKVYGADAADRQRAERIWRNLWYRTAGPSAGAGRVEQAEHEALALMTAAAAEVPVPLMLGAGQTPDGDVVVVATAAIGRGLDELAASGVGEPAELTDGQIDGVWRAMFDLHERAGITHGGLVPRNIRIDGDLVQFVDFANSSMFPSAQQTASDVVTVLASLTTVVGAERSIDSLLRCTSSDDARADVVEWLPYVQAAVLPPELRAALKRAGSSTKALRVGLAERLEVDQPEPAPVRRVRVRDVVLTAAAMIAANALITQIADVGFDTLVEAFREASPGWFVVAFLINLARYPVSYIGIRPLTTDALPVFPTALLQSAKSFVGLVVPTVVGRVGMDVRFLQNLGVPLAAATTQGPIISLIGFVAEVVLLLVCAWSVGQELDTAALGDADVGGLIVIALLVVAVGVVVVFAVGRLRNIVVPFVRDALSSVRDVVTSPRILGAIFFSESLDRVMGGLALGATVAAFGLDLPLSALIFVSVGTGLLAGLAPVPGGIGVAEATMAALLGAVGVPPAESVTIAITHRVLTSYLPPVLGFFSLRWLTREGYL